ncbi:MAG: AbrB/MazE/SpoVT family DNA-binding domain-containing protein, partial [Acidimicrobiia bacterium]
CDTIERMETPTEPVVVEVGAKGRVVIPAAFRAALGITEGSRLIAQVQDGALILVQRDVVRRQLLDAFALVGHSLSKELLAERRAEAQADLGS